MVLDSKDEQTVGADPGDCLSRDPGEAATAASAVLPAGEARRRQGHWRPPHPLATQRAVTSLKLESADRAEVGRLDGEQVPADLGAWR
jgi:hypothetical protein